MRGLMKGWMALFKNTFATCNGNDGNDGNDGGGGNLNSPTRTVSHSELWEASASAAALASETARHRTDLASSFLVIEDLQQKNSALGHQVKQLLLRTFSLKTAAITVCESAARERGREGERGEEKRGGGGGGGKGGGEGEWLGGGN